MPIPSLGPLSPALRLTTTELQTPTSYIDTCQLITPPNASDVRNLQNVPKTILDKQTPCLIHAYPHQCKTMTDDLQIEEKIPSTALNATPEGATDNRSKKQQLPKRTPAPKTGGGLQKSRKRRATEERARSSYPHTISGLAYLLATCTDEQYIPIIHQLPEGWSATNDRGIRVTKRQLEMAH